MSSTDYRYRCIELRGRLGSWDLDFDYHARLNQNPNLRGSSNIDSSTREDRYGSDTLLDRSSGWTELDPDCALDMLNINGLCAVVQTLGLSMIQFVGDAYTEEQVRSVWTLIGIDATDLGQYELIDGQELHRYRKTVHCPLESISFDIFFTTNENLVHTIEVQVYSNDPGLEQRYDSVAPVINNYITYVVDNTTSTSYYNANNGRSYYNSANTNQSWQNQNWFTYPYGNGGYSGGGWGGYGGYGGRTSGAVAPMYQQVCSSVPFQQQYQWGAYTGMGNYQGPVPPYVNPGSMPMQPMVQAPQPGRQFIFAGQSPNQDLTNFLQNFNDFAAGLTNYANSDDL